MERVITAGHRFVSRLAGALTTRADMFSNSGWDDLSEEGNGRDRMSRFNID